jgi:threonine dehydratase
VTNRPVATPGVVDLRRAGDIIGLHLAPTPVVASPLLGADVILKLETLQPTGSFKVRGALVAVAIAMAQDPNQRIVTASAGNHGLGVAFAAHKFGAAAVIVIPENASPAKRTALELFDVDVVRQGTTYDEAEAHALTLSAGGDGRFISAYNDPDVIAGQGTIALELFDQVAGLTTIIAPIGGGGLVAGLALAAELRDGIGVRGVESDASPAVSAAVAAGRVTPVPVGPTLADGLAGNIEGGSVTVPMIARGVEELAGADESSIAEAVRFLALEHGLVVEPSGAVAVAAIMSGRVAAGVGPTAVVVTGRNIKATLLADLLLGER